MRFYTEQVAFMYRYYFMDFRSFTFIALKHNQVEYATAVVLDFVSLIFIHNQDIFHQFAIF